MAVTTTTMAKQLSFQETHNLLKLFDKILGTFAIQNPEEVPAWQRRLFKPTLKIHVFLTTFSFISTLLITNFKLIYIILFTSCLTILIGFYIAIATMGRDKKQLNFLVDWCESLYNIKETFNEDIQEIAETHMTKIKKQSLIILKGLAFIFYVNATCMTLGFGILGLFLPESICPKFSVPAPFLLPFKNQETWTAFIPTLLLQTVICDGAGTMGNYVFGIIFCTTLHIHGYLDIVKDILGEMKDEMIKMRNKGLKSDEYFDKKIKLITDMVCNANSAMNSVCNVYTYAFACEEFGTLCSVFVTGLIITVVREAFFFGIGLTFANFLLYVIAYINERILDDLDEIQEAIMDLPWYDLSVKQQKNLLILLNSGYLQTGFTAARIHSLNVDRFAIILKAGYSNMLVLKDLVQK